MAKIISQNSITVFAGGRAHIIRSENRRFEEVLDAMANGADDDQLADLIDVATAVRSFGDGKIQVIGGKVYFGDEEVHNVVVDRIIRFISEDLPHTPLIRFLERLMTNPSKNSVDQLYVFLEKNNLPVTEDGHFLAYKAVTNDYKDKHTQKVDNAPGLDAITPMRRNEVDDNPNSHCSYGYHVGALTYVKGFACGYGSPIGDKIVVCEVDPSNVVSVPNDCNGEKMRVTYYKVICDYNGPLPDDYQNTDSLVSSNDDCDSDSDDDSDDDGYCSDCDSHQYCSCCCDNDDNSQDDSNDDCDPSDPDYTLCAWKKAVADGETSLSHKDWVDSIVKSESDDDSGEDKTLVMVIDGQNKLNGLPLDIHEIEVVQDGKPKTMKVVGTEPQETECDCGCNCH